MHFIRYAALLIAMPCALHAHAQPITLVAPGNVPTAGDPFQVHKGAQMDALGGEGVLMDYSGLTATDVNTYQWVLPGDVPLGGNYPEAEVVLISSIPDTIYYKATPQGLERVGHVQMIDVGTLNYRFTSSYSNAMLDLKLPSTYGDQPWADQFAGTYEVDGNTGALNGGITGEVAAWGRLIMPGGADTVDVVRMDTRVTESIPLTIGGLSITVDHMHQIQAYYPLWGKFPVLRMVLDSLNSNMVNLGEAYTEWLDAEVVGIAEQQAATLAMRVFPNPAREQVTVLINNAANTPVQVQVVDARGAVVLRTTATRRLSIDVKDWHTGTYHLLITDGQGVRSSHAMVVTH